MRYSRVPCVCQLCGKTVMVKRSHVARGNGKFCGLECLWASRRQDVVERFWSYVHKTDSCWLWSGGLTDAGYGQLKVDGGTSLAHRLSWEIHKGPIPPGMFVCHDCPDGDNPACVNPDHLWLGTAADNSADMVNKGRSASGVSHNSRTRPDSVPAGERHGNSTLSNDEVREMRREYDESDKARGVIPRIARRHNIDRSVAWAIIKRRTWKSID